MTPRAARLVAFTTSSHSHATPLHIVAEPMLVGATAVRVCAVWMRRVGSATSAGAAASSTTGGRSGNFMLHYVHQGNNGVYAAGAACTNGLTLSGVGGAGGAASGVQYAGRPCQCALCVYALY